MQGPPHTCQSQAGLRLTESTKRRFMAGTNLPAPTSHGWVAPTLNMRAIGWVALNVVRYGEWHLTSFGAWHPRPPNAHPDLPGNRFGRGASFTAPAWHEPTNPWTGGTKIPPNPNVEPTYPLVDGTHFSTQPPNYEHEVHSVGGTNDGSNWCGSNWCHPSIHAVKLVPPIYLCGLVGRRLRCRYFGAAFH